jgi:hypothetical protein
MTTDFDFSNQDLFGAVIFRPDFNRAETINANQAWSLFFTAGQEDKKLGFNAEAGRLFTNLLTAIVVSGVIGGAIFTSLG